MNASSSHLSVKAQLFSKLGLLTTILFVVAGVAFSYLTPDIRHTDHTDSAAEQPPRALLPGLQAMVGISALILTWLITSE